MATNAAKTTTTTTTARTAKPTAAKAAAKAAPVAPTAPVAAAPAAPVAFNMADLAATSKPVAAMPTGGGGRTVKANPFAELAKQSLDGGSILQTGVVPTEKDVNAVKNMIRKAAVALDAKATIRTAAVDGGWTLTYKVTKPAA